MKRVMRLGPLSLRERLALLAAEWDLYADLAKHPREARAYRDAAMAVRHQLGRGSRSRSSA
jgi:hypothetical protein